MAVYPLSPLISKCHITIWTRRGHDAGPSPSRQLQQARHSVHINASVSLVGTTLVHHLQMLAQRRTNDCAEDHSSRYYVTCTLTHLQTITNRPCPAIGPQRWLNVGPLLLVCIMNKTLAQHRINAYNSFHLYINILFFPVDLPIWSELSNRRCLYYSKQIKTWWQPCMVLTIINWI